MDREETGQEAKMVSTVVQPEESVQDQVRGILSLFPGNRSDLIPTLQQVQQQFGYLPDVALRQIAKFLNIPESTVYGVATFYAQFKLVPTGRTVVKVCRGTGCYVRGAPRILTEAENRLGIKAGETSQDLDYTLETVACFGSCALGPVMVVNDKVYGRMTIDKVKKVLEGTRRSV